VIPTALAMGEEVKADGKSILTAMAGGYEIVTRLGIAAQGKFHDRGFHPTSICGTDVHIYNWDAWAQKRIKPPMIFGHEFSGEVIEVGPDVKKIKVNWIKKIIGILMLVPALYYLNSFVPFTSFLNPKPPIEWARSFDVLSQPSVKPKMVIFTAEWCPPCKIMEGLALKDPEIVRLSEKFIDVKVDTTLSEKKNDILIERYGVMGWPTIVFVSPAGEMWKDLTISGGIITADQLKVKMEQALKRSSHNGS